MKTFRTIKFKCSNETVKMGPLKWEHLYWTFWMRTFKMETIKRIVNMKV